MFPQQIHIINLTGIIDLIVVEESRDFWHLFIEVGVVELFAVEVLADGIREELVVVAVGMQGMRRNVVLELVVSFAWGEIGRD